MDVAAGAGLLVGGDGAAAQEQRQVELHGGGPRLPPHARPVQRRHHKLARNDVIVITADEKDDEE
jgi:hypothetical protein